MIRVFSHQSCYLHQFVVCLSRLDQSQSSIRRLTFLCHWGYSCESSFLRASFVFSTQPQNFQFIEENCFHYLVLVCRLSLNLRLPRKDKCMCSFLVPSLMSNSMYLFFQWEMPQISDCCILVVGSLTLALLNTIVNPEQNWKKHQTGLISNWLLSK